MDKPTTQLQLYHHFLSFFLPEAMLDFFELVWMEKKSLDSRESKKDIIYTSMLHMYLDERRQPGTLVQAFAEQFPRVGPAGACFRLDTD